MNAYTRMYYLSELHALQMFMSAQSSGSVIQMKSAYERSEPEKNAVDVFTKPETTMGWMPRCRGDRHEPSNVLLSRQAGKVAVYATTQLQCATQSDDMPAFRSVLLANLVMPVACFICD